MPPKRCLPTQNQVRDVGPLPAQPTRPYPADGWQESVHWPIAPFFDDEGCCHYIQKNFYTDDERLFRQQFERPGPVLRRALRDHAQGLWDPSSQDNEYKAIALENNALDDDSDLIALMPPANVAFSANIQLTRGMLRSITEKKSFWYPEGVEPYNNEIRNTHVPITDKALYQYLQLVCGRVNQGVEDHRLQLPEDLDFSDSNIPPRYRQLPLNDPQTQLKLSCVVIDPVKAGDNLFNPHGALPLLRKWREMLRETGVTDNIFLLLDYIFIPLKVAHDHWILAGYVYAHILCFLPSRYHSGTNRYHVFQFCNSGVLVE